jgi:hypothetical protein
LAKGVPPETAAIAQRAHLSVCCGPAGGL